MLNSIIYQLTHDGFRNLGYLVKLAVNFPDMSVTGVPERHIVHPWSTI